MNYEEKYNEILEWARKNKARLNGVPIEEVLPELSESEDERIRKDIINLIYWLKSNPSLCSQYYKDRYDSILTWLEKQKEQKPEWSEEDEKTINDACCWIAEYAGYLMDKNYGKASMLMCLTDKLKSLRSSWKPSEEQMEVDLDAFHREAAKDILAGFASKIGHTISDYSEQSCKYAIQLADELIKQLKEEKQ